jgi:hypothetical protein
MPTDATLRRACNELTEDDVRLLFSNAARDTIRWEERLRALLRPKAGENAVQLGARLRRVCAHLRVALAHRTARLEHRPMRAPSQLSVKWQGDVEVVYHGSTSFFARERITLAQWNASPFTTLRYDRGGGDAAATGGWPRVRTSPDAKTLYDAVPLRPATLPNALCLFHGTIGRFEANLLKGLRWTEGVGALGPGFYLTTDPNTAKAYACRAAEAKGLEAGEGLLVLEVIVKDAHRIRRVHFDDLDFLSPHPRQATVVLNALPGFEGQLALRGLAVTKHCEVRAVHHLAERNGFCARRRRRQTRSSSRTSPRRRPSK